jgi:purine-binding chemotaxis protein CheW
MPEIVLNFMAQEQEMLLRRTEELARKANADNSQQKGEKADFLLFSINHVRYALEKQYVHELHLAVKPVFVPCVPDFIKGIVNVRGDILSVMDLAAFIGNPELQQQDDYQMFRITQGRMDFGVLVEGIEDIYELHREDIHAFEVSENARINRFLIGMTHDMVHVLDGEALLSDDTLIVR